jgi:hypothetical protein
MLCHDPRVSNDRSEKRETDNAILILVEHTLQSYLGQNRRCRGSSRLAVRSTYWKRRIWRRRRGRENPDRAKQRDQFPCASSRDHPNFSAPVYETVSGESSFSRFDVLESPSRIGMG